MQGILSNPNHALWERENNAKSIAESANNIAIALTNLKKILRSVKNYYSMETKFNFNSQVATSREQSERLLALGLKKETADMVYDCLGICKGKKLYRQIPTLCDAVSIYDIPAWSLHRLIEIMPNRIRVYDYYAYLIVSNKKVQYYYHDVEYSDYSVAGKWEDRDVYHNIISCIEWLIKEGYFNKEYLEDKK